MRIIVTGANGFLFSRLVRSYSSRFNILPLDKSVVDITEHGKVSKIFEAFKPQIIVHGAAISATGDCENNPELAYKINVESTVNIGKIAKEMGSKVLFLSTEQVFNGNEEDGPYGEDSIPNPNTVYGETKLKAEELLLKELEELWIIRLSWMFGIPERSLPNSENLFMKTLTAALKDEPIKLSTNEYRGVTYAYDFIENFVNFINMPFGIYHFGSTNEMSTFETAQFILKELGISEKRIDRIILRDDLKHKAKKRDLRLSYDKIKGLDVPVNTTQESIKKAINEFSFIK